MRARSLEPRWYAQRILVLGGAKKYIFLHRPARQKNRRAKEMSAWGVIPQQRKKKKKKKKKQEQNKRKNEAGTDDRDQLCEVAAK
jgi:hypothetical protein